MLNFELLRARKEAGLTQPEIAKQVGMDKDKYGRIERGISLPDINEAYALADVVGKRVEEIFLPQNAGILRKHTGTE